MAELTLEAHFADALDNDHTSIVRLREGERWTIGREPERVRARARARALARGAGSGAR